MARARLILTILTVSLLHELSVLILDKADAQEFSENPSSSVILAPNTDVYGALSCTFTRASASDVIGWVVDGTRISNDGDKITTAINASLGESASNQIQIVYNKIGTESWKYDMDFYDVTTVVNGDYKCQLCTDESCGTVLAESNTAQVRVEYEPSTSPICYPTSVTRVVLGESTTLYCQSDPGIPTVQLQWLRNSEVISPQDQPVLTSGVLFNNYTFTPGVTDDDPGVTYGCRMTSATNNLMCSITPFIVISTPHVSVLPPSVSEGITLGSSATYTCSVTSDTNTPIVEYIWNVQDVDSSRLTYDNDRSVTIADVTVDDHGKSVQCEVTDAESMTGSGQYLILVEGEVIPSNLPTFSIGTTLASSSTTVASAPQPFPLAAIIVIAVVGFILLCFLFGGIWFCCNKKKQIHIPPTVVKNDLSPTSASPINSGKASSQTNIDQKHANPDIIPRGLNERSVDVDEQEQWNLSSAPYEQNPDKHENIPYHPVDNNLQDPYMYNPAYDDKVDPADLDFKMRLGDHDYSDSGIGYRDDYGYPTNYEVPYRLDNDHIDKHNLEDREYGDGRQDSYSQDYADGYNGELSNYGTVYGDEYQPPPAHYDSYDAYPDRMPDGSEGYEPPPEEHNGQAYNGYSAPTDNGIPDYSALDGYSNPPNEMGYEGQSAQYDDRQSGYDYQPPHSGIPQDSYSNEGLYEDHDSSAYHPERIPDGGPLESDAYDYNYPPENDQYGDEYSNEPAQYNDEAGYAPYSHQDNSFDPTFGESYQSSGQPQSNAYYDLEEEVSATSNPSYV